VSQSPQQAQASKSYQDAWRAVNLLIRSDGSWSGRERNVCRLNRGDGRFEDVSYVSGLDLPADGRAFVATDLDSDGDLDLLLKNRSGRRLRAFRNDVTEAPRMLTIRPRGRKANRDGVGLRLTLKTDRRTLVREVASGAGFLSQRPRQAEFGLATDERLRSLRLRWPGGETRTIEDLPTDGVWLAVEGESALVEQPLPRKRKRASEAVPAPTASGVRLAEPVPAPDFELESTDGERVSLSGGGGKTLVNFWATWCPPCRTELADFARNAEEFKRAGVRVLAVSVDEPAEREAVRAFAADQGVPFPVLFADDQTVNAYTVLQHGLFDRRRDLAIPTSFLIDEAGDVLRVYRGETAAARILAELDAPASAALPFEGRWIGSEPQRDFVALGAAYAERGLPGPAVQAFERALASDEPTPELANNLAGALIQIGDLERAETLLKKTIEANPGNLDAALNLAALLLQTGQADEARSLAARVAEARPDDASAWSLRASAAFSLGDSAAAETYYRRAIEADAQAPEPWDGLGALQASASRFDEAIESYERAVEFGAESAQLHSNLGVLYMQTGSPARGLLAFQEAARLAPDDYGAQLNLALYYLQSGSLRQAAAWAEKARAADPSRREAYRIGARAAAELGDRTTARTLLEQAVEIAPDDAETRALLDELREPL